MRALLFSIDRLEFVGGGQALLGGRCCGDLMKTGDEARWIVFREEDGRFEKSETVLMRFPEFEFYGRKIRELEPGHAAGVFIPNEVASGLRFGWYLKGENA